jgi:lysozyme
LVNAGPCHCERDKVGPVLNWLRPRRAAKKLLTGVDVSVYQGPPGTWVKEAGNISWAAVKLTEYEPGGTRYVNPDAKPDWDWLKDQKKGRIAYLYGHPSTSAADTVELFIGKLRSLGLDNSDAVALDLEEADGKTADQVADWAGNVMSELERRLSRKPLLYTFVDFARSGYCAGLEKYPLWIANPGTRRGKPTVPHPWKRWAIHQYVITGPIDRDVANFASLADMAEDLGKKEKEPVVKNLGGTITGAVASARWPGGEVVVAGLSTDGYIQATRLVGGIWSAWTNISMTQAQGSPSLTVWPDGNGALYYIDTAGAVIELATVNHGETWT